MPADLRIHAGLGKNTLFLASALPAKKRKIFRQPIHPLTDGGDPLVNWGKLCVVGKRGPPTLRGGVTGLQAGNPSKAVPRRFAARLAAQPAALARRPLVGGCRAHPRAGDHPCAKHCFHRNRRGSLGLVFVEGELELPRGLLVPPRSAGATCRGFPFHGKGVGRARNCARARTDLHSPTDFPAGRGRHHCRPKPVTPRTHRLRAERAKVSTTTQHKCELSARASTTPRPGAVGALFAHTVTGPTV